MNLVRSCVMYEPGKKPRYEKDSKVTTAWINVCRNGNTHGLHSHEPVSSPPCITSRCRSRRRRRRRRIPCPVISC